MDESNVHFMDGGNRPVEHALGVSLVKFEESVGQHLAWEQGAEVLLSTVSMSTLSGLGVIEFGVLNRDIVPHAVKGDFVNGFPIMVNDLVQQLVNQDEALIAGLVEELHSGFLGWAVVSQGWDPSEKASDGDPMPIRMTAYYNIGTNAYWVARRTMAGDVQHGWGTPSSDLEDPDQTVNNIYHALRKMTEASHYVRIGRDLLGQ